MIYRLFLFINVFSDYIKQRPFVFLGLFFYLFTFLLFFYLKLSSIKLIFIFLCTHLIIYIIYSLLGYYTLKKWAFSGLFFITLAQLFSNMTIHPFYYSSDVSPLLWSMFFPSSDIILSKKLSQPTIKAKMYWLRIMLGNDYKGSARFTVVFNGNDFGLTKFWNQDTSSGRGQLPAFPDIVYSEMYCEIPSFALSKSLINVVEIRQLIPDSSLRIRVIGSVIPSFVYPNARFYDGFEWHDGVPSIISGHYIAATPMIFLEAVPEVYQ